MDTLILLSLCLLSWRGIQGQHDYPTKVMNSMLGHKISLPCEVYSHDDSSAPTLQWLYKKNGNDIVIYTSGPSGTTIEESDMKSRIDVNNHMQLVIEHTKVEDEKLFACRVKDQNGKVKESNVHLRVYKAPDAPEITMEQNGIQITDEAVQIGECETKNGFPTPNITWYRNNTQLKTEKNGVVVTTQITVESNGLITVKSVLSSPVYKTDIYSTFYCEVSYHLSNGAFMKESDRKNLTVDYPNTEVKLFVKSQHEIIKEGDKVQLICMGDGHPQPQMTLFRKDEETPLVEDYSYSWTVSRKDSGGYICKGLSMVDFNEMEAETELHVHYLDPPVLSEKSPFIVELGSVHSVSCHANASAHTDTHWTQDGSTIAPGSDLSLSFLDYTDVGRYACVASVTGVPGLSQTQELLVILKGKPQVTISPNHVEVQDGDMLTVKCTAVGNPTPKITWYINGTEEDAYVANVSDSEVISELSFQVTQNHLNGRISCKAENEINSSMDYIQLQERFAPAAVPGDHRGSETTMDPGSKEESEATKDPNVEPRSQKSYGVVIVAVIVCILLLAVLGAVLYFLYKKGRIPCGRSGKKDITKPGEKDQIVVEMKPDSPAEESVLLPGAQDKMQQAEQERYMDLRN